jgi:hypothetical protein
MGGFANLSEQLAVSEGASISRFIGFVNYRWLVGVLERVTVNAVV